MHHYTLNTGHTRISPRSEIAAGVLPRMAPLLAVGEHDLGELHDVFAGYRLVVPFTEAGYFATLYRGDRPLRSLAVAATAEDEAVVWPALEGLYLMATEAPGMRAADFQALHRPPSLPWVAVALVDPLAVPGWAGDFERCLAWAFLVARARA
jgi:hypothetical protein